MQDAFAESSCPHSSNQIMWIGILEQIRKGTSFDHAEDLVVFVVRGQNDDLCARRDTLDLTHCCHSVHIGHEQVEQDHIGEQISGQRDGLDAIAALAYNDDIGLLGEQKTNPLSDN